MGLPGLGGPHYGDDWWFTGLLAFARQDQRRFAEAERLAEHSLALEPRGGTAVHARTHVYYETGEHAAGLRWLDPWIATSGRDATHRAHFSWHAALHELALDDTSAVLGRYQRQLAPPAVVGTRALVDSASLLWRCQIEEVDVDIPGVEPVLAAAGATSERPRRVRRDACRARVGRGRLDRRADLARTPLPPGSRPHDERRHRPADDRAR